MNESRELAVIECVRTARTSTRKGAKRPGRTLGEFLNLSQETNHKMAKVADYYSINEAKKPADKQVYHDNDQCIAGRDIPKSEQRPGRGGYRHCNDCDK
jgi:hypothetical protein